MSQSTKKPNHLKYREEVLDPISKSFCAAKWLNVTLWLHNGTTASCHHPKAHKIDAKAATQDPSRLHNTPTKIKARRQMLAGERPEECDYCWRVEDISPNLVSDRFFKSSIYHEDDIHELTNPDLLSKVIPKTLEVAFDNKCQFACTYCNRNFSSKWDADIKRNGPYQLIKSGWANTFKYPVLEAEGNPYIAAFWKWWPTLSQHLTEIRVTGGEPLLSPHTWQLIESLSSSGNKTMRLAINSNLGCDSKTLDKLLDLAKGINEFHLYTSNETVEGMAEYIREGMNWKSWTKNVRQVLDSEAVKTLHFMMTISALSLHGLVPFLDYIADLRKDYPTRNTGISVNILRFPHFQSVMALPQKQRLVFSKEIEQFLKSRSDSFFEYEIESLVRLAFYLKEDFSANHKTLSKDSYARDLKVFVYQFNARRGLDHNKVFPEDFSHWLNSV